MDRLPFQRNWIAGVLAAAMIPFITVPATAQFKTRKQAADEDAATPAPKKKLHAKATPAPADDSTDSDPSTQSGSTAKGKTGSTTKSKSTHPSATPKPKQTDADSTDSDIASKSDSTVKTKSTHPSATPKPKQTDSDSTDSDTASKSDSTAKTKGTHSLATPKPKAADADADTGSTPTKSSAATATIAPEELLEFHAQPAGVKKLIEYSLDLTKQNLTYAFGSDDPAKGGMDCSGFIYHVLRQYGLTQVPRDSSGQYVWVRHTHGFRTVVSRKPESFEFDELLPGDLLFWTGTYSTDHDPPISHVMIYLGTEKSTGHKVMVGSSDGRSYHGQKRNGVSVFDFIMPRTPITDEQRSTFVGYARIPGLRD